MNLLGGKDKRVRRLRSAWYNVCPELGIQYPEILDRNVEHLRYLIEMNPVGNLESIHHQRPHRQYRRDIMLGIILHHVIRGDKHRHVSPCLRREIIIYRPEVKILGIRSGATYRLIDVAGSAVIRRDSERPVAIYGIQILQIGCRTLRRHVGIPSLIHE